MSLILDALRKSEAERRRGQAPDLFAPAPQPLPVAAPTASRAPWLPLAIAAGLAMAAVTAWRLVPVAPHGQSAIPAVDDGAMPAAGGAGGEPASQRPPAVATTDSSAADGASMRAASPASAPQLQRTDRPPTAAVPAPGPSGTASGLPQAPTASASPGAMPAASPVAPRPRTDAAAPALPDPALVAAAAAAVATPVRPADSATRADVRPVLPAVQPASTATARPAGAPGAAGGAPARTAALPVPPAPPVDDGTLRLSELPSAERSQLPPLKMSMHMWSPDASQRFVILDGSRVGQGDRVGEAVVEEITRDSAVLAWRGRRLQVPLR